MASNPIPIERTALDIGAWFFANGLTDCRVWLPDEWAAKGETMGEAALLHLTFDNNLILIDPLMESEPLSDLRDLIESRGYFVELGYSWSGHLYPLDPDLDPQPKVYVFEKVTA